VFGLPPILRFLRSSRRLLFRRDEIDADLDAEIRSAVELLADQKIKEGMPADAARRAARMELGGVEQVKEAVRSGRAAAWLDALLQDVRFAVRMLRKSRGFTIVAVLTLALGIGANTAIFSIVEAIVLRPLPFKDSQRVAAIWWGILSRDFPNGTGTLEAAADYEQGALNVEGAGAPQRIPAAEVSASFFRVFALEPLLGRTFSATDEQAGHAPVVILSQRLWQTRYHADPNILRRTIYLNGKGFAPIGVLPPRFDFPAKAELWLPSPQSIQQDLFGGNAYYRAQIGRLRLGATLAQARAEMAVIQKREGDPKQSLGPPKVETLHDSLVGDTSEAALLLFGAVGFILLIACADVANLLLARGAGRVQEIAVRRALGAARPRLIRQFLSESILLSAFGGAMGVLFGWWAIQAAATLIPARTAFAAPVSLDGRVLGFACALAIASGIVAGILPALQSSGSDLSAALKEGARSSAEGFRPGSHRGMRNLFGIVEIAFALILVIGATLFLRSLNRLLEVRPGFRTDHVLVAHLSLLGPKYRQGYTRAEFLREARMRVRALPGVRAAGFTNVLPLDTNSMMLMNITVAGPNPAPQTPFAQYTTVSPGYFRAMGIRLLAGRDFAATDVGACAPGNAKPAGNSGRAERIGKAGGGPNSPGPHENAAGRNRPSMLCSSAAREVAIVSESLARAAWPGHSALGQHFWLGSTSAPPIEVVGIADDIRSFGPSVNAIPIMYFPVAQERPDEVSLVVYTAGNPLALTSAIRKVIEEVDPDEPVSSFSTMDDLLARSVARPRFRSILLGIFGALALLLAWVGVYGVISYTVAQRTHEIGVRVALGASRGHVLRIIAAYGLRLAAIGIAAGLFGAFLLARLAAASLYGIRGTDPLSFTLGSLAIVAAVLLASYLPARRAMRVDPMTALRHE